MIIRVSSELPLPADVVAGMVRKPAVLRHVAWPILGMPGLPAEFPLGGEVTIRLYLLGAIPLWRHTIEVVGADGLEGRTEEHGGPLRAWRHRLVVTPISVGRCRYTDEVDLDAGRWTSPAAVLTRAFYCYRHRRWASLARLLA